MIIDLTQPLDANTPVYPGDPPTKIEKAGDLDKDGFYDNLISVGTHVGTHVDAPIHMVKDGKKLKDYPISHFEGRGRLIKVEDSKFDLDAVRQADISQNDIVLFHTGWDSRYKEDAYFEEYPQIPEEIAQYLVDQKVRMVGMDMASPDHEPFPIHKVLLSNDVLIIENLTNLEKLVGKEFRVIALPINLQEDAAPARVIAELK